MAGQARPGQAPRVEEAAQELPELHVARRVSDQPKLTLTQQKLYYSGVTHPALGPPEVAGWMRMARPSRSLPCMDSMAERQDASSGKPTKPAEKRSVG